MQKKIVVGITGASGAVYGKVLLERMVALQEQVAACGIIFSENARAVWKYETGEEVADFFRKLEENPSVNPDKFRSYSPGDLFAPMASGSAGYDTMIICPCTMGTLGRIAAGISSDLLTRTADVMLKERQRLILVPRESPYNLIHLTNMKLLTEAGAVIFPASPSFYSKPVTIEEMLATVTDRILLMAGFDLPAFRWGSQP